MALEGAFPNGSVPIRMHTQAIPGGSAAAPRRLPVSVSRPAPVEEFDSVAGRGVMPIIGGERVLVGRPSFLEDEGVASSALPSRIAELE